ncbi:MAG: transglycosylase domain-containing protein [Candidatus Dojkabacteria bacterium]
MEVSSLSKRRKASSSRGISRGYTPTDLSRFINFKKYSKNSIDGKRSKNQRGGKNDIKTGKLKLKAKKALYIFIGILFFLGCVALIGAGIYLKNLQGSLPSPNELVERTSDQSTQILDRDGKILYTVYGDQNREFVSIDKIPEHTKWALLAAEDIEFYQHKGVDYLGILKATVQNITEGSVVRGASTITQQLVKNTILYDVLGDEAYKQTYSRKIKEVLITMQVEQSFSKDEILQLYMNEIPLGGVNYGFQAAANSYFGKDVSELSLAESALIAGLIQSPGVYSPLFGTNPDMAKDRQTYVLDQMLKHSKFTGVTEEEVQAAKDEELVYKTKRIDIVAPHFVFYVKQILEKEYGVDRVERGGLKVTTTLDSSLQQIAEEEVVKGVGNAKRFNVNNGGMVVLNPKNGDVLAMVGSVDYWNVEDPRVDGNVNITVSQRQMGSAVKPFVYLTAINQGYGPWMLTPDIKGVKFGTYQPTNWNKGYEGLITARKALVLSRNVPAVYTLQLAGIDNYLQTMEKLGVNDLSNKSSYGLSLGLGSGEVKLLEHTSAYGVLANGGLRNDPSPILKVETSKGEVLMEREEPKGKRVFDEKEVYLVNWMICDLNGFADRLGNAYYYVGNKKLCGKTGTTDDAKDLTAFLYHQNLVVGVWGGNNNNEKIIGGAWGENVSMPIANSFMRRVIDRYAPTAFNRPAGILTTSVCIDTGATPAEGVKCKKEASVYIAGRAPQVDNRKVVEVCTSNGLIPTNLELAKKYGLTQVKTVILTKLENTFQRDAYEKYLLTMKKSPYLLVEPQSGICPLPLGVDNAPLVEIIKPVSNQQVEKAKNLEISGNVRYLESITEFKVRFDDQEIAGASLNADGSFLVNYFVPLTTTTGNHTITVSVKDNHDKVDSKAVTVSVIDVVPVI